MPSDQFKLLIGDKDGVQDFDLLPYQAELILKGPQNIECGTIKLNDVQVHNGFA